MSSSEYASAYAEIGSSADTSRTPSRPGSPSGYPGGGVQKEKKATRVRFNSTSFANDTGNKRSSGPLKDQEWEEEQIELSSSAVVSPGNPPYTKPSPTHSRNNSTTHLLRHTPDVEKDNPFDQVFGAASPVMKPRPGVLRSTSYVGEAEQQEEANEKSYSALAAQERAQKITASLVRGNKGGSSRRGSIDDDSDGSHATEKASSSVGFLANIPLGNLDSRRTYDGAGDSDGEDGEQKREQMKSSSTSEAHNLVRQHTRKAARKPLSLTQAAPPDTPGHVTPTEEYGEDYVPRPTQYRGGVLSSLLKLYNPEGGAGSGRPGSRSGSRSHSRRGSFESEATVVSNGSSGATTPKTKQAKWYNQKNQSQDTLAGLVAASAKLAATGSPAQITGSPPTPVKAKKTRPGMGLKTNSGRIISTLASFSGRPRLEDEIKITIHIAETLSRQKYIVKLCRALVQYGAPTHRLEEYLKMSSRVLEIDAQFLYIPDCMMISFGDATTHTSEFKLVKSKQGVDLGKLKDVHEIYKEVVHDVIGVEEATQRLDSVMRSKLKYNPWLLVFMYGFASASVAPFAFEARLIDLPIAFFLGCIVGYLQLILAPKSELYSNVFEISAAVITSFLARAFGSIRGGELFCFSALAQSSIALILPGYMVLCASLELQSRSIIAGSVRMVYAIIYSLFLGYGITIGTALYGFFDHNATSATTCTNSIDSINPYFKWFFVPAFTLCLTTINQAKWKQVPAMVGIAFTGYVVNFFGSRKFPSSPQISNTLGALAIGVLGNLYSRVHHGVAAAALLPAIFVQVPSGLAASGSLLAGLSSADQITNTTFYANGTSKVSGTSTVSLTSSTDLNTIVFNVGVSMIQVAIGITVGLFMSALIVYPLGKRRSGLFSF